MKHKLIALMLVAVMTLSACAAVGLTAVNAQTSPQTPATPGIVFPATPTTLILVASSQSVRPGDIVYLTGYLMTGASYMSGRPVSLYYKIGTGSWTKLATTNSNLNGMVGGSFSRRSAQTVSFELRYAGQSQGWLKPFILASTSNVVKVKFENTETKPYQTTLYASASAQVTSPGTTVSLVGQLQNGVYGLGPDTVTLWQQTSSGSWQKISTGTTLAPIDTPGGWVKFTVTSSTTASNAYRLTFAGAWPYAGSTSNTVLIDWRT